MSDQKNKSQLESLRQQEFERKRLRGEISCAECRRLKLKCDKRIPCSSCKRRGCPTICPNGVLSAGQGTRFVLADTNTLHSKLDEMSERIRELESGLQVAHAAQSSQPHPLLSEKLLAIKDGVVQQHRGTDKQKAKADSSNVHEDLEVLQTFGTLRIGDDGSTRFLGPSAASEGFLLLESNESEESDLPQLHDVLQSVGRGWPFNHINSNKDEALSLILAHLPTWERASALCESFLANNSSHSKMMRRTFIVEQLLPWVYGRNPNALKKAGGPHDVALAFMIFALGAAVDLTQAPDNDESLLYKQLGRAALSLQSVFSYVSLSTVQAVALLANIDIVSSKKPSLEEAWKVFSFALLLGKSIGIHRDPARWNLGEEAVEARRTMFWELYNVDNWQSLASGRSPVFLSHTIDVEYPKDDQNILRTNDGHLVPTFQRARYRLVKEVLAPVTERLSSCSEPLRYIDILNLDRKIRDFDDLRVMERYVDPGLTAFEKVEKVQVRSCRDIVLVYLHRNFFAKALMDCPSDPLKHTFSPSFLAGYRCASNVVKLYSEAFREFTNATTRFWPAFGHILASGVIVGAVPAACPKHALAHGAYKDLELAIDAFNIAPDHPVSKRGLPVLHRLKEKGHRALFGERDGSDPSARSLAPAVMPLDQGFKYEEIQILQGNPLVLTDQKRSNTVTDSPMASSSASSIRQTPEYGAAQQAQMFMPMTGSSYVSSPSSSGTGQASGSHSQQENYATSSLIHPDVFQWISSLEGSTTEFNPSAWLQTKSEAAAKTFVTDADLAAALAMFQAYSSTPPQPDNLSNFPSDPAPMDYNVDMSLLPEHVGATNNGSSGYLFNSTTPGTW